jgi:hypothetical protein
MCVGIHVVGRHSIVSVAIRYELDRPGIESQRGRDSFAPVQAGRGAHSASYTMGTSPLYLHGRFQGGPLLLYVGIHEKCPLFLSDGNQTFIWSTYFSMNNQQSFTKIHLVKAELFIVNERTDIQRDGHDGANSNFSQIIVKAPWKFWTDLIYAVHWESGVITQEWQFPLVPLLFRRHRSGSKHMYSLKDDLHFWKSLHWKIDS